MIKILCSLFTKRPPRRAAAAAAPYAQSRVAADFRAVCVDSSGVRCAAAKHAAEMRFLTREAPRLPLADCTMKEGCHCRYRKVPDRREGERRAFGGTGANVWYRGADNRTHGGRRHSEV